MPDTPAQAPEQVPQGRPIQDPSACAEADGLPPLYDTGNWLLATAVPSQLLTGKLPVPAGEVGIVTIRTTTATITVTLTRGDAAEWADTLAELRDSLSGSGLQAANTPSGLVVPGRRRR
jgi:hypothetical protein